MKLFTADTSIRINGNYGTSPDMASIWLMGRGLGPNWANTYLLNINFSSSIPATYVGIFFYAWQGAPAGGDARCCLTQGMRGYGVNAGGTSFSANNQNEYYFNIDNNNANFPDLFYLDGANRRMRFATQALDYGRSTYYYFRIVSRYISYITISWE